ncbi:hypothetical protein NQZ68_039004 [Dissostichus eleginoides]|nr:hypothetical protein NQZ68_039004 [Dissostichus eleginoides]
MCCCLISLNKDWLCLKRRRQLDVAPGTFWLRPIRGECVEEQKNRGTSRPMTGRVSVMQHRKTQSFYRLRLSLSHGVFFQRF